MKIEVWATIQNIGGELNVETFPTEADAMNYAWEIIGELMDDNGTKETFEDFKARCNHDLDSCWQVLQQGSNNTLHVEEIEVDIPAPTQQTPGDAKEQAEADEAMRTRAHDEWVPGSNDGIDIDDDAKISRCEDGSAWVQAWVYVHPDAGKEDEVQKMLLNFYNCTDCDIQWQDKWFATCDDKCPGCGKAYSPFKSEDADGEVVAA